ncbi:MAG: DUF1992 domain-containing protein [Candidatus Limnocylindria bacterium]|nr:DUF1992 domain-containing protein [Candidatus Limnocylindria bacterium]
MDDTRTPKLRKIEREAEERSRELARSGELQGLPGQGEPLRDDDRGTDEGWAARHLMRQANVVPEWAELRREIDERTAKVKRRLVAHREWLHDRTRLLAELPAERIVDVSRETEARDARVRAELDRAVSEVNALIRRYDLVVVPAMQLPLVMLERLG